MNLSPPAELLSQRYRAAASNYSLTPFDALSLTHRDLLRTLELDAGFYGLLMPLRPGLGYRTADQETAALIRALEQPALLPPETVAADLASLLRLVLDGVLEVEWNGVFLTGPEAHGAILGRAADPPATAGLSLAALQYAESLEDPDPLSLAERLYCYHRLPITAQWRKSFSSPDALDRHLGVEPGGIVAATLDHSGFVPVAAPGWHAWQRSGSEGAPVRKLYISPLPRHTPEVLRILSGVVARLDGIDALKIGQGLTGILRPDKCVVYLTSHQSLLELAGHLRNELHRVPGHGVPFTALLADDGLLSWAADPLESDGWLGWAGAESWRSWVVKRLAAALVLAQSAGYRAAAPIQFAVDRLALEGVDPVSWSPADSFSGYAAH